MIGDRREEARSGSMDFCECTIPIIYELMEHAVGPTENFAMDSRISL